MIKIIIYAIIWLIASEFTYFSALKYKWFLDIFNDNHNYLFTKIISMWIGVLIIILCILLEILIADYTKQYIIGIIIIIFITLIITINIFLGKKFFPNKKGGKK